MHITIKQKTNKKIAFMLESYTNKNITKQIF